MRARVGEARHVAVVGGWSACAGCASDAWAIKTTSVSVSINPLAIAGRRAPALATAPKYRVHS
jgi:hypothetical protein